MNSVTCSGDWIATETGIQCQGTLAQIPYQDLATLFSEYLAPDPEIIGLVSVSALVFWLTGIGAGRVVQLLRKT